MRDSRSKRKNEILKMVLRDNFTLEGNFFSIKKNLKASRKYHKISLSEPSGDSKK